MTTDEIFKDQPELLKEPAVKDLIKYVQDVHKRNVQITQRHMKFHDDVFDLIMYSNVVLIDGKPCDGVVEKILELIAKV